MTYILIFIAGMVLGPFLMAAADGLYDRLTDSYELKHRFNGDVEAQIAHDRLRDQD